jgi:hypothetical protein
MRKEGWTLKIMPR